MTSQTRNHLGLLQIGKIVFSFYFCWQPTPIRVAYAVKLPEKSSVHSLHLIILNFPERRKRILLLFVSGNPLWHHWFDSTWLFTSDLSSFVELSWFRSEWRPSLSKSSPVDFSSGQMLCSLSYREVLPFQ